MNIEKSSLGKLLLEKRGRLSQTKKSYMDNKIFKNLIENELYKNAKTIFIFVSFGSEVDTHKIMKRALKDGKKIGVSKIKTKKLE